LIEPDTAISLDTLDPKDLLTAYWNFLAENELESLGKGLASASCFEISPRGFARPLAALGELPEEELAADLEEFQDIFQELAPEGCYFGSHRDDGAAIGFWSWGFDE